MNVLEIENISKLYRLGLVSRKTFSEDFKRLMYKMRGKEDPFALIGGVNDRTSKTEDEYVWALKDVSFNVGQGDVIGIIGKNGAGKSTLLKLLSRVTSPTKGEIRVRGRIAALLEVGTGFHTELTGRENIYLNGSILGMTKSEVKSKFDEIVDFSGVEKYIDTPVKRYSSGMLVRLGFAVAAHLEPEILIVDEVLAVGDIEFQRRCLGKMQSVSNEGRTILFVSHNMKAVEGLCKKGIILENGQLIYSGTATDAVLKYMSKEMANACNRLSWPLGKEPGNEYAKITNISLLPVDNSEDVYLNDDVEIEVGINLANSTDNRVDVSLEFFDDSGSSLYKVSSGVFENTLSRFESGNHKFNFKMNNPLNVGVYYVTLRINENRASNARLRIDEIMTFEVKSRPDTDTFLQRKGILCPQFNFSHKYIG